MYNYRGVNHIIKKTPVSNGGLLCMEVKISSST
jgi:hypothetical protein